MNAREELDQARQALNDPASLGLADRPHMTLARVRRFVLNRLDNATRAIDVMTGMGSLTDKRGPRR